MKIKAPKRILLTWEFGNDLGHLARLRPVALELKRRGHEVILAASNLQNITALPESLDVIPAPAMVTALVKDPIREPATFADILYNAGVTHGNMLAGAVRAWRGIFELVKPDVVVQDYSPVALIALQGFEARSMLLGTGFACPPDVRPLPEIRAWQNHYPERMQMTEQQVLTSLNRQLSHQGQAPLAGIGELFTRTDAVCLATFAELDHYPDRAGGDAKAIDYVGIWSDLEGQHPHWPEGAGPRIFAYLKPFKALPRLLDHLGESGHPCLVYFNSHTEIRHKRSANLRIVDSPLDMARVSAECDMAILHAGHGSTASMLLAGKPILQLPFNVEQFHTAKNTERFGAGLMAKIGDPVEILGGFDRLIADATMREAAAGFALRHKGFNQANALNTVVDRIVNLSESTTNRE